MRRIRHRHLKRLLDASWALPEPTDHPPLAVPKSSLYALPRSARLAPAPAHAPPSAARVTPPPSAAEKVALRLNVARCLRLLASKLDDVLPGALASARQAWDRVDTSNILGPSVIAHVAEARRALHETLTAGGPVARAMALEGLVAVDTAWGLTRLFERRLSSLIRLRVRSGDAELLPDGWPFLDLAAALHEAAHAWS